MNILGHEEFGLLRNKERWRGREEIERGKEKNNYLFLNSILFANYTGTFSKLCNVTEACRGALSSTPPYLTGSRPRVSVRNKTYKLHLKD
jgi:hypothetical protein